MKETQNIWRKPKDNTKSRQVTGNTFGRDRLRMGGIYMKKKIRKMLHVENCEEQA